MPKQYFDKYIDKRTEMLLKYNAAFEKGEVRRKSKTCKICNELN